MTCLPDLQSETGPICVILCTFEKKVLIAQGREGITYSEHCTPSEYVLAYFGFVFQMVCYHPSEN
jgi:hypothetical protein